MLIVFLFVECVYLWTCSLCTLPNLFLFFCYLIISLTYLCILLFLGTNKVDVDENCTLHNKSPGPWSILRVFCMLDPGHLTPGAWYHTDCLCWDYRLNAFVYVKICHSLNLQKNLVVEGPYCVLVKILIPVSSMALQHQLLPKNFTFMAE